MYHVRVLVVHGASHHNPVLWGTGISDAIFRNRQVLDYLFLNTDIPNSISNRFHSHSVRTFKLWCRLGSQMEWTEMNGVKTGK